MAYTVEWEIQRGGKYYYYYYYYYYCALWRWEYCTNVPL
jgi:hypothetical protein